MAKEKRRKKKRKLKRRKNRQKVGTDEREYVTWAEFKKWTVDWLIEKFINSSQRPNVVGTNTPICFFYRDVMIEGYCPKASTDTMQSNAWQSAG